MVFLRLLVFSNLFLIPIFLHPYIICRHFIHIGHEPFHPKTLQINSYELYFYNLFKHSNTFIHIYPLIENENIFQQLLNYLFGINKKTFYPNLIKYTNMYIYNYDLSPFFQSFLSMYISYFFLIYCSSLVHVYRIQFDKKPKTLNSIRYHIKQLIESSYLRWIIDALLWKLIGIILSHIFYVLAIKISMQRLFLSYEHYHLNQNDIYSSWNVYKNIQLIYKYEGWNGFFNGILSRIIYELGITLIPRLIWWPLRSLFIQSTIKSYFNASSIEFYFIQCICENLLRCFSIYLQICARITTIEIVNHMHEHINRKHYPLLRHHPWLFPISINSIDAKLITKGLSIFFRQAN